jgi:hypothetical protein
VIEFDINVGNCLTNTFPDFALEGYSYESLVLSATPLLCLNTLLTSSSRLRGTTVGQ